MNELWLDVAIRLGIVVILLLILPWFMPILEVAITPFLWYVQLVERIVGSWRRH